MNENEFWQLITSAKGNAVSIEERPGELKKQLSSKSPEDLQAFYELYIDQITNAYRWDLWGAAYVIGGGCSDDGFDYFRDWLISEGREVYERALSDPETLSELPALENPELEEMRYVADIIYKEKTGEPMSPRQREYIEDPIGNEWDEDSVDTLFPKLAKFYW